MYMHLSIYGQLFTSSSVEVMCDFGHLYGCISCLGDCELLYNIGVIS